VQKTLALATLAALALSALAAMPTLLAALSGFLLLLTRLLLAAALLAALTAHLVLLSTLLTTLILLARLLFVGVHICSFDFLPGVTTSALKRSSSKPSAGRRKRIQSDPAVSCRCRMTSPKALASQRLSRRPRLPDEDCRQLRKKKPPEAGLYFQLLLMAATPFTCFRRLLCLVAGFAQGWPGFAHEQMFSECDVRAKEVG
jgi:hypothetical protein